MEYLNCCWWFSVCDYGFLFIIHFIVVTLFLSFVIWIVGIGTGESL